MSDRDREREEGLVVSSADELLNPSTRRKFVRLMGMGGAIVMLPSVFGACGDSDAGEGPIVGPVSPPPPPPGMSPPPPASPPPPFTSAIAFDLRTDVGIFRLVHALEIVERAFYTAVVTKSDFTTIFNTDAQEVLRDIRNAETIHEAFVRNALGSLALPDFTPQLNPATLAAALSSRDSILATSRMLETLGVAGLNGAGKYLRDARNLLIAGKIVSVEARHLAAIRELLPPAGVNRNVAFASDDTISAVGALDVKLEAGEVLARVRATNIISEPLNTNITISNAPTAATQGSPTPDFFPTTP